MFVSLLLQTWSFIDTASLHLDLHPKDPKMLNQGWTQDLKLGLCFQKIKISVIF